MKHVQEGQYLKRTEGQKLVGSHSFSPETRTHCPTICPFPHVYQQAGKGSPAAPPPSSTTHLHLPLQLLSPSKCQTSPGTLGCHSRTCLNYRCMRWQRALMSFSSSLPTRRHREVAGLAGGEERWQMTFHVCLQYTWLQRRSTISRRSGCHALLSPPLP